VKYNGRGLDVNVAVFHQLFDDFQLNTFNGIAFEVENINSCSEDLNGADTDNSSATGACTGKVRSGVRSAGVEFEVFSRPLPNVTFNIGGAYARTRYRHNLVGASGEPISNQLFQLPGRQLSNAAEFTMTSSLGWTPPIGSSGMHGLFYIDWRHMSTFNTGSDLDLEKVQDNFNVFNARVGLRGPNERWAVELWANNLFNKDFIQVAFDAPLQGSGTIRGVQRGFTSRATQLFGAFLGEPRTYGLTLRGKFGAEPRRVEEAPLPPPPPPPPPQMQNCPDGSVVVMGAACPVPPPPPPPPPPPAPEPERG
jgi:outer membrane receptor protein involved in Fe transport